MQIDERLSQLAADDTIPAEQRTRALEMLVQREASLQAESARKLAEKRSSQLELLKIVLNPTIAAALIGIVTLLITNSFTASEASRAAQNNREIESFRADFERLKLEMSADSAMRLEERKFQFDVIKAALSDSKESEERANALKFLSEIGILAGLEQEALEKWANSENLTLPSFASGAEGAGRIVEVPRKPADAARIETLRQQVVAAGTEAWMTPALNEWGVQESAGPDSSADVMRYAREAGLTSYPDDDIPWSGLFVAWAMKTAGHEPPAGYLGNRNWLGWGVEIATPIPGAVVVGWRGSVNSPTGILGFYLGEQGDRLLLLGGNVGNAVGTFTMPKEQLLGYRLPPGFVVPPTP